MAYIGGRRRVQRVEGAEESEPVVVVDGEQG